MPDQLHFADHEHRAIVKDRLIAGFHRHIVHNKTIPVQGDHVQAVTLHPEECRAQVNLPIRDADVTAACRAHRPLVRHTDLRTRRDSAKARAQHTQYTCIAYIRRAFSHMAKNPPVAQESAQRTQHTDHRYGAAHIAKAEREYLIPCPIHSAHLRFIHS